MADEKDPAEKPAEKKSKEKPWANKLAGTPPLNPDGSIANQNFVGPHSNVSSPKNKAASTKL
ncbi:MAG: hypothetical protein Q7J80_06480 [Anaerolineales bacterium]|nr:hypothetical protein [Anaerolineales bacterium]